MVNLRGRDVTWSVDDGQIGAVLVLDLNHDLLGPELLLPLQPLVLILNVLLQGIGSCSAHQLIQDVCNGTLCIMPASAF